MPVSKACFNETHRHVAAVQAIPRGNLRYSCEAGGGSGLGLGVGLGLGLGGGGISCDFTLHFL